MCFLIHLLGLSNVIPHNKKIRLTYGTVRPTMGKLKNIQVQVELFVNILDLFLLEVRDSLVNSIPFILGRDFLATSNAVIRCSLGWMTISSGTFTRDIHIFSSVGKGSNIVMVKLDVDHKEDEPLNFEPNV